MPDGSIASTQGALLPYGQLSFGWLRADVREHRQDLRRRHRACPGTSCRRRTAISSCTARGKERIPLSYRNYQGRKRHYNSSFPGIVKHLAAALRGDRVRAGAREDRGVHGRPCPARRATGHGSSPRASRCTIGEREHPRVHAARVTRVATRSSTSSRSASGSASSAAGCSRRSASASRFLSRRRARLPEPPPRRGHALRRRGAAHPAGHPDRLGPGRRALHPRRAEHRAAPARQRAACSTRCCACATWATPCSSSSTTRRPCARPITSSTWAPARACTAAKSSRRARPTRSWPTPHSLTGQYLRRHAAQSPSPASGGPPRRAVRRPRRAREQPQEHRRRDSRSARSRASPASSAPAKSRWSTTSCRSAVGRALNRGSKPRPASTTRIDGIEHLDKVIDIDQSPIGRTPRSNPATYTGMFDDIRELFARLPGAEDPRLQSRAASASTSRAAAARTCQGDGQIKIEMHFLPDVYVPCEVCDGKRYNRETLEITYKGKNIADVLDMTVEEAVSFFANVPQICAACSRRWTTSAWATSSWASRRRRCPAARRSGSSWPPS